MLDNRMLRKMYDPIRQEVPGENKESNKRSFTIGQIKKREMVDSKWQLKQKMMKVYMQTVGWSNLKKRDHLG
jgi:hypothetical protein